LKDEGIRPADYLDYAKNLSLNQDASDGTPAVQAEDATLDLDRLTELAESYDLYTRLLREQGGLDFGDLIVETMRLFRERPAILARYREQFRYVLVDEFQDTNWAQYELVKLLCEPRRNLTVVGDDDQSIYKFRGASVANILGFKKDFPESIDVVLTTNYRSTQPILDAAYGFIQKNNPNRLEVQLSATPGQIGAALSKRLSSARDDQGSIETVVADTEADEARQVVAAILEAKNTDERAAWSDFAILVRANDHAELFLAELERNGLPYQYVASRGLYRTSIVLDILAYLRLLDNYHESVALQRVLNLPMFSFSADDVILLNETARRQSRSTYAVLRDHALLPDLRPEARKDADRLLRLIADHAELARRATPREVIVRFLEDSGYLKWLSESPDDPKRESEINYANQFLKEVVEFERGKLAPSVRLFLEVIDLAIDAGELGRLETSPDDGPDSVKVMTVHAAKGLEFRTVFVVHLVDQRFPSRDRAEAIPVPDALVREMLPEGDVHLEEERRLLYVALTRAKERLVLTRALDYGGARRKKASVFLEELGFVTKESAASERTHQPNLLAASKRILAVPESEAVMKKVRTNDRFDYSRLSSYEICPWKFRYRYVLDVPVPGNSRLSYGSSVHATLHEFFKLVQQRSQHQQGTLFTAESPTPAGGPSVSLGELKKLYERAWLREWYPSEKEMEKKKAEGWSALERLYASHEGKFPVPLLLEQPFTLKFDDIALTGKIDRVDAIEGDPEGVEIIDYKTGAAKAKPSADRWYQLLLYALAVEDPKLLGRPVRRVSLFYVDENVKVSKEPTDKERTKAKDWALEAIQSIRSANFTPTPDPFICGECEFNRICPSRAGKA
jgi:DNA helicase-2/ATP-dependent DNA helicase PcrA